MLGPVASPVVAEVLAAADLHVAPGRSYPVARSMLEAMSAGCVVLASDNPPNRECITPGQTGLLVDAQDSGALVQQALAVLADPGAFRALGDEASALVRSRYTRDVCLPRLAEEFSALASNHGGRP
jgi:glycosyltransferase involved in cell wall biosynthesis